MTTRAKTADEIAAEVAESMFPGQGGQRAAGQPIIQQHAENAPLPGEKIEKGGAGAMPTGMGGALGGLAAKAPGQPLDKAKEEGKEHESKESKEKEAGEEEEEDEDEKEDEDEEKSLLDADDLMKSMDALDAAADGIEEQEIDRRAELAKGIEDGTLTDEERSELIGLLGGQTPTPAEEAINKGGDFDFEESGEAVEKGFDDVFTEEFNQDYDVSPFLEKFGHAVGAGLDIMREDLSKSANDQQRFNKALSKSFRGVAMIIKSQQEMVKSLSDQNTALAHRLGIVEHQPVPRKSMANPGQAKALSKSFVDSDPGDGPNREQIFNGLHMLMAKYKDVGGRSKNGEPIDRAMSAFELSGNISKSLLAEVKDALGSQR